MSDPGVPPRAPVAPERGGPHAEPRSAWRKLRGAAILLLATMLVLAGGALALRLGARRASLRRAAERINVPSDTRGLETLAATLDKEVKSLQAENRRLRDKVAHFRPKGLYIVIDTGADFLYVMKDDEVLRKAVCSTGSGVRLADPNTPRSWVFDTPRGELTVRGKITDPIWVKPDWAFIETGEAIPRARDERMEEGVLGDYALDLGQGYLIHGTLFERALGLHVTHGCVRMGSKDLEFLFKTIQPGTKVYIV
jgi:L,D-transpeptidase-like protein